MKRVLLAAFIGTILSTTANATCTIKYACGTGATGPAAAQHTVASGKVFTPSANTCTRDGYVFSHYLAVPSSSSSYTYIDAGVAHPGVEYAMPFISSYTCSKSVTLTLTAQWVEQNPSKTTSKKYTDAQLATRQPAFAGDANGADKLMLFSGTTDGEIGSRDIVTTLGTPNATTGDYADTTSTTVPTNGAIKTGVDRKQDTITGTADYVLTYTRTAGTLSSKPVYNATTRQYSNAVVEASTLNTAVIDAVNSELTQVDENGNPSSNGTLWRINDTVTLLDATKVDLRLFLFDTFTCNQPSYTGAYISNDGSRKENETSYGLTQNGTFVVEFDIYSRLKRLSGRAQCSTRSVTNLWSNNSNTFESDHFTTNLPDNSGRYCYCMLDGYTTTGANWGSMQSLSTSWVANSAFNSPSSCATSCVSSCSSSLYGNDARPRAFRSAIFNSVQ